LIFGKEIAMNVTTFVVVSMYKSSKMLFAQGKESDLEKHSKTLTTQQKQHTKPTSQKLKECLRETL